MDKEALDFLSAERIGCLAVMQADSTPHTATIHFSSTDDGTKIFIQTARDTKKAQALDDKEVVPASFTTGFSETEWKTLQLDGTIRHVRDDEKTEFETVHYAKNPEAKKYASDGTAYLVFEPTWWRYSDYNIKPVHILEG